MINYDDDLLNNYYNCKEETVKIHTYKQFIKEDYYINKNNKVINEKKEKYKQECKKEFILNYKIYYDKLKKNKYNIEIKNSINELNRKYLSTYNEIRCKDILI